MEINEAKSKICDAGRELLERGLVARTWGNISARISSTEFVITPSGMSYERITPDDLVTVNIETLAFEGNIRPSSEKGVHASVYKLHPGAGFVIHTHQDYATAFSILGKDLSNLPEDKAAMLGSTVPVSEYALSGTKTLQINVTNAMQRFLGSHAVLMKSHGAVTFGETSDDAFRNAFALERYCQDKFSEETGREPFRLCTPEEAEDHGTLTYHTAPNGCNIFAKTDLLKLFAQKGRDVDIYTDDAAQLFGTKIRCLPEDSDQKRILTALKIAPAVMVKNKGAVFFAPSKDDCEAAFMILEKNCLSAFLSEKKMQGEPLSVLLQVYEHAKYLHSYSKLK